VREGPEENHCERQSGSAKVGRQHGITSGQGRATKGLAGRAKGKAFGFEKPALYRERPKPHAPICRRSKSSACWRDFDVLVPGFLDQTLCANFPGGKRVTVRRREDVTSSGGRGSLWSQEDPMAGDQRTSGGPRAAK
jgi:hypothetical protein